MLHVPLPLNSTLRDVVATLDDPIEYVRRVLEHMATCKKCFRTATVTIGLTIVPQRVV